MKKRPVGVALLALLFIASNLITLASETGVIPSGTFPFILMNSALLIFGRTVTLLGTALLMILGFFVLMLREKARKIFVLVQALLLLNGIYIAIQISAWAVGDDAATRTVAILFGSVIFNVFPIVCLIFFTRPQVKEQFRCITR